MFYLNKENNCILSRKTDYNGRLRIKRKRFLQEDNESPAHQSATICQNSFIDYQLCHLQVKVQGSIG